MWGIYLILILALTRFSYAYGSKLDWGGQHYEIPDYFRKLFYETGEFFPSYAANLGGGENIYNFSYYGLFSPIVLLSYLFPFVNMCVYMQAAMIICIMASIFIFYRWMCEKFDDNTAFVLGLVFMFSGPLIFHSHRHIMFVSYMPFLLLSFKAAEDYINKKKKYKLVIFLFLTIISCWFYSVSCIVAVTIYAVFCYLKSIEKFDVRDFFKTAFHYAGRVLTAVLMAGVLILPTLYCLLSSRDSANVSIDFSIFLPTVNFKYYSYATYSMGLGFIFIPAVISAIISKDKSRRFLGICLGCLVTFEVFIYLLNGTLYVDSKVLIAFMPLGVLIIGQLYKEICEKNFHGKIVMLISAIYLIIGVCLSSSEFRSLFSTVDLLITAICIFAFYKKNKKAFLNFSLVGCIAVSTVYLNFTDKLVPIEEIKSKNSPQIRQLAQTADENGEFVRTNNLYKRAETANMVYNGGYYSASIYSSLHNKLYNNFYFNQIYNENEYRNSALTTSSKNILFNIYMSQKYIISDEPVEMTGYEKLESAGEYTLYKNDDVLSLGYADSKLMSYEEYESLEYPYNLDALMNYTIVDRDIENVYEPKVKQITQFELLDSKQIKAEDGKYIVEAGKDFTQNISLNEQISEDEILLIAFDVDNTVGESSDTRITINGQKNTLTERSWKYYNNNTSFEYALTSKSVNSKGGLEITFTGGRYDISNIRCYVMEYDFSKDAPFKADTEKTQGDKIEGTITVPKDGYFNISIPYQDGFSITVNGEEVSYEKVDGAFVGFPIKAGENKINIEFKAPLLREGKLMSLGGFLIFIILVIFEKKSTKK